MRFPYENQLTKGVTPMQLAVTVYKARNLTEAQLKGPRYPYHPYQPMGHWHPKKDFGIWYPIPLEVRPCCWGISPPSIKYGYQYHRHCRTLRHVAMLCNVDDRHLARELDLIKPRNRCECGKFRARDDYLCRRCRDVQDSLNAYSAAVSQT